MISIVGLDVGNITTVCVSDDKNVVIESRLKEYTNLDELGENEVIEFDNKRYVVEQGQFENNLIKHEKDNFLPLMYYAISRVTENEKVKLVIGIPAGQYNSRKDDLKEFINDYDIYNDTVYDKSKWKAKVWNKSNLSFDKKVENIKSNIFDDVSLEQKGKYFDEISKKLEYIYPHKDLINKPASISVSEIKKDEENYENMFEEKVSLKRPMFIENKKLTSTEKGLAMHLVMQIIDTNNINTIQDINNQLEHFVEKGILTSTQKDVINPYKIIKFFKSDLGKRMLNSSFVKKEQTIYSRIKVSDVYDEVKTDDTIMLRGIVDVYFEEDDEIVIIDYKTDYVTEENKLEIINKYKKQVELYKEAITNLTGKTVKETYLYLFGIDEAISI